MRNLILGLIVFVGLSSAACNDKGKQFAATTDRVAGYVGVGLQFVDQQTANKQMSPETGLVIVNALRQINDINGQLVTEAKTYLDSNGNLVLTGDGQQKLLKILGSFNTVTTNLLNDPEIAKLEPEKRERVMAIVNNITATVATLGELINTVKLVKEVQK